MSGEAFWISPAVKSSGPFNGTTTRLVFLLTIFIRTCFRLSTTSGHVLHHAGDRGEFVGDAVHTESRNGIPRQRRKKHAPHGVTDGDTEPSFKGLDDEAAERRRVRRFVQVNLLRHLECSDGHGLVTLCDCHLLRVQFDDQLFVGVERDVCAFRNVQERAGHRRFVQAEPRKHGGVLHALHGRMQHFHLLALVAHLHRVAGLQQIRRDIHRLVDSP